MVAGRREPAVLRRIRAALAATLTLGIAATIVELLLLGHTKGFWERSPLWLLGVGLVVAVAHLAVRRPWTIRVLRVVLAAFVVSGLLGIWLHYRGNVEFELEMYPSREGWELFREALTGATPTLAAGAMVVLGVVGFIYTIGHPLLDRD